MNYKYPFEELIRNIERIDDKINLQELLIVGFVIEGNESFPNSIGTNNAFHHRVVTLQQVRRIHLVPLQVPTLYRGKTSHKCLMKAVKRSCRRLNGWSQKT